MLIQRLLTLENCSQLVDDVMAITDKTLVAGETGCEVAQASINKVEGFQIFSKP